MNKKIGKKRLDSKQVAVVKSLTPFEDITHLAGICELNLGGRKNIGALILKSGNDFQIKFCFDCKGIHPNLDSEQILPIFDGIEAGLKEIPEGEFLTINLGSFTSDKERQAELKEIEENCSISQLKLLVRSERLRIRELTNKGVRKNKFLRLWCTYTVLGEQEKSADLVEKAIRQLQTIWFRFTGEIHAAENLKVESILYNSFNDGFLLWESILNNKMKLETKALSPTEIWELIWKQFNATKPIPIPNPLKISEIEGLQEEITSDFHIKHQILETQDSLPLFDRKWVKIGEQFIGTLNFSEKPGGWVDEYAQLRYLWDLISKDTIYNTEIFCQLSKANQGLTKTTLQRLTKQVLPDILWKISSKVPG